MPELGRGKVILEAVFPKPGFPKLKVLFFLGLCPNADPVSV